MNKTFFLVVALLLVGLGSGAVLAQDSQMTFFITSAGSGNGADLGGLEGADRHCQASVSYTHLTLPTIYSV